MKNLKTKLSYILIGLLLGLAVGFLPEKHKHTEDQQKWENLNASLHVQSARNKKLLDSVTVIKDTLSYDIVSRLAKMDTIIHRLENSPNEETVNAAMEWIDVYNSQL